MWFTIIGWLLVAFLFWNGVLLATGVSGKRANVSQATKGVTAIVLLGFGIWVIYALSII